MIPTAVVVDYSATMRKALRLGLEEAGVKVLAEGASGSEALSLYERHKPTLMTLDIVLPGMDGIKAATEILKKHPFALVIMCSALSSRERVLDCHKAGVAHFLLKPFLVEKVGEIARNLLGRRLKPEMRAPAFQEVRP